MNQIKNLKPWTIGRQTYRLNTKPFNMYTTVYPLVDHTYQFDAVLEDILQKKNVLAMEQTSCFCQPKMVIKKIAGITVRDMADYKSIYARIAKRFKNLKNFKFDFRLFRRYNFIPNSEYLTTLIRNRVPLRKEERFISFIEIIFEELNRFTDYVDKYLLVPLDYVRLPMLKGKYTNLLYKDRNASLPTLLLCYMKMYPKEFIEAMKRTNSTLLFYSKFGVFRLSHKDLTDTVVVKYKEGIRIVNREDIKLYAEHQYMESEVYNKLYSEAYTVQEDKLIDATLVALRKLKGEGYLAEDIPNTESDDYTEEVQEDEVLEMDNKRVLSKEDEDLEDALYEAIDEDIITEDDKNEVVRILSPKYDKTQDKVVSGVKEDGAISTVRVRELKLNEKDASKFKAETTNKIISTLTNDKSSDEEIEIAEDLGRAIVAKEPNAEEVVRHIKRMKDVKLNRTKVYNSKEQRYLKKIKESTVEDELSSAESLNLETTVLPNVDALDDIAENKFMNFNKTYEEKVKDKDMTAIANHFSKVQDFPLYSQGIKEEDASDKYNSRSLTKIQFRDPEGNQHNVSVYMPKLINNNKMYINGTWLELQSQRIVKPIVKFGDSVMLSFNYNKAFMELSGKYITKYESQFHRFAAGVHKDDELKKKVKYIKFGYVEEKDNVSKTLEFDRISRVIERIYKDENNFINFRNDDSRHTFDNLSKDKNVSIKFEMPSGIYIGYFDGKPIFLNTEIDAITSHRAPISDIANPSIGLFLKEFIEAIGEDSEVVKNLNSYSTSIALSHSIMKIMSRKIPTILILSYTEGLDTVLDRSGVEYELVFDKKKPRVDNVTTDVIEFKDCYLVYSIQVIEHAILFSGLKKFDLTEFTFADFCDSSKGYAADLIASIGNGNLPLYVTSFQMLFVDPQNEDVLKHYNLPTSFLDVLLYSNMLLSTHIIMKDTDMRLYRIRNAEIIPSVLYKVLADAYADYHIAKKRGSSKAKFEVPKDAVMKAMFEQANVQTYSTVNPLVSADSLCKMTTKGLSGLNLDRGYTLDKRLVDPSSAGVRAMPSVYSGGIGIVQRTSIDPNIVSPRGYLQITDEDKVNDLSAKQILSPTELMTPSATNKDDSQRVYMNMQQKGHAQGILHPQLPAISNGYDEMIGYQAPEFCHYMEKDGVVTDVTDDFVMVKYDDGTEDAFRLDNVERHAAKAKYIANDMRKMKNIKRGVRLSAKDPIAYNQYMFVEYDGKPVYCTGNLMNVCFMSAPGVYEDATCLSETATKNLASFVNKSKVITITKDTIVKEYNTDLKSKVKASDILFSYAMMSTDTTLNDLLDPDFLDDSLIKKKKAGTAGIISEINVYYACDKSTMSNSLRTFVNKVEQIYKDRGYDKLALLNMNKFKKEYLDKSPAKAIDGTKVANKKIRKDDVVIEYIIQSYSKVSHADKVTYFNALKGETSKVLPDDMMPVGVETGTRVDCMMSPISPMARKVISILEVGAVERLIAETMSKCQEILGIESKK